MASANNQLAFSLRGFPGIRKSFWGQNWWVQTTDGYLVEGSSMYATREEAQTFLDKWNAGERPQADPYETPRDRYETSDAGG
jgi:hypothetical protein